MLYGVCGEVLLSARLPYLLPNYLHHALTLSFPFWKGSDTLYPDSER